MTCERISAKNTYKFDLSVPELGEHHGLIIAKFSTLGVDSGTVEITCLKHSWKYTFGSLDENFNLIEEFFVAQDTGYLAGKMVEQKYTIPVSDPKQISLYLKGLILKMLDHKEIELSEAKYWISQTHDVHFHKGLLSPTPVVERILGCEWWRNVPEKECPEYALACEVINSVKSALKGAF